MVRGRITNPAGVTHYQCHPAPRFTSSIRVDDAGPVQQTCAKLFTLLQDKLTGWTVVRLENNKIAVETCEIVVEDPSTATAAATTAAAAAAAGIADSAAKTVSVTWTNQHEDLGAYILGLLQNM